MRDGIIYYVFPGGGIEKGETPEEAAKKEAFEELGVEVMVNECIAKIEYNGTLYFFLSEIINGTFGTGQGEDAQTKREIEGYICLSISKHN
ncbi:NUDIX domain-containing protein [Solibacillus sp. FSL K6-1781]